MSTSKDDATSDRDVENTIPVLAVSNLQASIRFYQDVLGFKTDWGGDTEYSMIASVSRDDRCIMLQCREPLVPGCVWIGGNLLVSLWNQIRDRSDILIVKRPTNQRWALEMKIQDPDSNILWFGTESLKDVPFGDEVADNQMPR